MYKNTNASYASVCSRNIYIYIYIYIYICVYIYIYNIYIYINLDKEKYVCLCMCRNLVFICVYFTRIRWPEDRRKLIKIVNE